tara:strand:+ start:265 stop:393 length:129 start_codon:yes stop_codon:yes gene_type:complete
MGKYNKKTRVARKKFFMYSGDLFSHLLFAVSFLAHGNIKCPF